MKNVAICALFAVGVSAVPMVAPKHAQLHQKRDIVWVTETDVDIVTVPVTVFADGTSLSTQLPAAASPSSVSNYNNHHHFHGSSAFQSSAAVTATVAVSSASPVSSDESSIVQSTTSVAVPETTTTSDSVPVTPASTTSTSDYVAPSPTSEYVPPTTTAVYSAPAYTTPASTYQSSTTTTEATSSATTAASLGSQTYSGDLTYYDVGLGSCGEYDTDDANVVALAEGMMDKSVDCFREITITWGSVTQVAKIVDTCPGCAGGGLDLSPSLFASFAPTATGRVHQATWSYN